MKELEYRLNTFAKEGITCKWGRGLNAPCIYIKPFKGGTWYPVDEAMWDRCKALGVAEGVFEHIGVNEDMNIDKKVEQIISKEEMITKLKTLANKFGDCMVNYDNEEYSIGYECGQMGACNDLEELIAQFEGD